MPSTSTPPTRPAPPHLSKHLPHQPVGARERGVHREADADKPARHGVLQLVLLGKQRHHPAEDGDALDAPLAVLGDDARPDLHLLAHAQHALRVHVHARALTAPRASASASCSQQRTPRCSACNRTAAAGRGGGRAQRCRVRGAARGGGGRGGESSPGRLTCKMDPPATPPLRSSTSEPGLVTSNERMTIICGGDVKSLRGGKQQGGAAAHGGRTAPSQNSMRVRGAGAATG